MSLAESQREALEKLAGFRTGDAPRDAEAMVRPGYPPRQQAPSLYVRAVPRMMVVTRSVPAHAVEARAHEAPRQGCGSDRSGIGHGARHGHEVVAAGPRVPALDIRLEAADEAVGRSPIQLRALATGVDVADAAECRSVCRRPRVGTSRCNNTVMRLRAGVSEPTIAAFDLTFSAPKSVSVLFAVAPAEVSVALVEAHEEAVRSALGYLEEAAVFVRRGAGGARFEHAGGLIAAAYRHRMSRALDPQLHTHVVAANLARGEDGRYTALHHPSLYRAARTAGISTSRICARWSGTGWGWSGGRSARVRPSWPRSLRMCCGCSRSVGRRSRRRSPSVRRSWGVRRRARSVRHGGR